MQRIENCVCSVCCAETKHIVVLVEKPALAEGEQSQQIRERELSKEISSDCFGLQSAMAAHHRSHEQS